MTFAEPDKLYKKKDGFLVMSALIDKHLVTFWFDEPSNFRVLNIKEFAQKVEKEGWIQLN